MRVGEMRVIPWNCGSNQPQPAAKRLMPLPLLTWCVFSDRTTLAARALSRIAQNAVRGRGAHRENEGAPLEVQIKLAPARGKAVDAVAAADEVKAEEVPLNSVGARRDYHLGVERGIVLCKIIWWYSLHHSNALYILPLQYSMMHLTMHSESCLLHRAQALPA